MLIENFCLASSDLSAFVHVPPLRSTDLKVRYYNGPLLHSVDARSTATFTSALCRAPRMHLCFHLSSEASSRACAHAELRAPHDPRLSSDDRRRRVLHTP